MKFSAIHDEGGFSVIGSVIGHNGDVGSHEGACKELAGSVFPLTEWQR